MAVRLWIAAALVAAGSLAMQQLSHGEPVVLRAPLAGFPLAFGGWSGWDVPLAGKVVAAAGLDDYLNRSYGDAQGKWATLFISYYRTQRTGQTIHSPKNCLPGAGWQPLESRPLTIPIGGPGPLVVNEYYVARGTDRALVLYWYQERGRSVASEYAAKWWLTVDALTRNRTDGALVRVTTPMALDRRRAERRATNFVRQIVPRLGRFIPN
jgi:EpsI family protein